MNNTQRLGEKFNAEIEDIKQKRLDSGIDKKRKSTKKITNKIVSHKNWEKIKEDTIEVDLENEK